MGTSHSQSASTSTVLTSCTMARSTRTANRAKTGALFFFWLVSVVTRTLSLSDPRFPTLVGSMLRSAWYVENHRRTRRLTDYRAGSPSSPLNAATSKAPIDRLLHTRAQVPVARHATTLPTGCGHAYLSFAHTPFVSFAPSQYKNGETSKTCAYVPLSSESHPGLLFFC